VEIIDYKTGSAKEEKNMSLEDKEQLLIYQIAAEEVHGFKPKKLTFYYLDNNKKISFLGDEDDKEKLREKLTAEIEDIKTSDFHATPGWQCEYCNFKDICEFRAS